MKKLPTTIYVKWENESTNEPYLNAAPSMAELAEIEPGTVALYKLVEEYDVRLVTQHKRAGTKRWPRE